MKFLSGILGGTLMSVVALASANAADIYVPGPASPGGYKDAPWVPTWAGFYAGVNGGYGWESDTHNLTVMNQFGGVATTSGLDPKGGFGGGQIGYNWQSSAFVFGVEGDIEGSGIESRFSHIVGPNTIDAKKTIDWFSTIRGRLGYSFGNVLLYGTGGVAFGGVNNRIQVNGVTPGLAKDTTETGYTAGGGVEYAFNPRWSVKLEYQFIDLGRYTLTAPVVPANGVIITTNRIDNSFDTVRIGVNYHFGADYVPLK